VRQIGDVYGPTNFGTFMSFMQLGSALFCVVIPFLATAVNNAVGSYNAMYWVLAAMLVAAAGGMAVPPPKRRA
jgi:hypothetical protein